MILPPTGTLIASSGIILDLIGAAVLAKGLIVSDKEAARLGSSYWMGESWQEDLQSPPVADRIKQSTAAKWGLSFLGLGFMGQLIGGLWPYFH